MIILKVLLYIILAVLGIVLGLLLLVLILPLRAEMSFVDSKLKYSVKFSLIPVLDSEGGGIFGWLKKRRKGKKPSKPKPEKKKSRKKDSKSDDETEFEVISSGDLSFDDNDVRDDISHDDFTEADEDKKRSEKINKIKAKKKKSDSDKDDYLFEYTYDDDDDGFDDDDKDSRKKKKKTLGEKVGFLLDVWDCAGRPLLKIFRGFHIYDVYIDFIITNPDAYKCAINYGRISGIIYNLLAWMSELFTVKFRTVDVQCGFAQKKSRWDASFKLSFRAVVLVIAGLWFLIAYIFKIFIPNKIKGRKAEK